MPAVRLLSRFDPEVSVAIEAAAARGWPAAETEELEGWLLRRTDGVPRRRCNSLLPPADSGRAGRTLDLALATAEELDFPAVIQVSPAESHRLLDAALAAMGLRLGGETLVLAGSLPAPRRAAGAATRAVGLTALTGEWVDDWEAVAPGMEARATAEVVLSQLDGRARFATAADTDGRPVGVGVGVLDGRWLGVFSVATAPHARRRGVATAMIDALESWGAAHGATRTYLQVEADNAAALALYAQRGLHIAHAYHYRAA